MRCARIIQNCMLSCETIFTRIRWNFLQRVWARNSDRHPERSAAKPKIPWRCGEVMLRNGKPGLAPKAFGDALQPRLRSGKRAVIAAAGRFEDMAWVLSSLADNA